MSYGFQEWAYYAPYEEHSYQDHTDVGARRSSFELTKGARDTLCDALIDFDSCKNIWSVRVTCTYVSQVSGTRTQSCYRQWEPDYASKYEQIKQSHATIAAQWEVLKKLDLL